MAARGHVQDPNDRRLRPIYDYLDNGNNKMAIQQADKLLKKHKDLHCAKVLKAIGLQRTGKQDEAFTLAQEVAVLEPTDDNSLQALTILYREMHRPELVTKLYEAAVRKVPTSEEYHSHLFMAYARVGEYKKMQQAGMALYKIVPKNPYYFWSVMSLVMQSISAQDEKLSQTMFLPLAERMVEKMVKEEKIEAEAEVQLYFMILERLGKYVEALEVVQGPLGEKLTSELQSRENKCMMLYRRLERWAECNALSCKLLLKNPDDWQFYLLYFDSLFQLIDQSWKPPQEGAHSAEGEVHASISQALSFMEDRIATEEAKESKHLRGPYLARLELIRRLRERSCPEAQQLGEPLELMFQFFVKFGDKPCCITDLKIFLDLLTPDQHVQFINRLMEAVPLCAPGEDGVALPGDTRALQRHLCVTQLSRSLGQQHALNTEGKLGLIKELKAHYQHGLQFGKQMTRQKCYSNHKASNVDIKILPFFITSVFLVLSSSRYLLTRYAESLGQFAAASQSCNFSLRFFHSNQKDTSEYIIQAYKYGAFEKIPEFIGFRNRLNHSLHFAQVRTERMLLDLFLEADISSPLEESVKSMSLCPEEDDIPWDSLRDNRDLTVLVSWDPKDRQLNEEHRQRSLEEDTLWLRLRSLTLRLIGCVSALTHPPASRNSEKTTENGVAAKPSSLQSLLSQLENTLNQATQFTEKQLQYPFVGPVASRLAQALSSGCCQCQLSSLQLPLHLQELEATGLDESSELQTQISNLFKSLAVQLQDMLEKCKGDLLEVKDSHSMTQHFLLENLVYFVETVCIVLWVSNYCGSVLRPLKSSLQKKKKKKKEASTVTPPVLSAYQEFSSSLQSLLNQALEHIKSQEISLTALKLEALSLEAQTQSEAEATFTKTAMDKVQSSYLRSLQEIGELLKKRADTLKSLKI
uniref:N-alpha-acetyltransferase 25, NatB auxiliary subunit n=1 Tax=Cyprinus carpio TaxID=7962 RepID=A0A8C2E178_CYPCA